MFLRSAIWYFYAAVNSRILFDQMLGRATRLCDEIGKQTFRIFDAVRLYEALQGMTEMQPVVQNPNISFSQLVAELATVTEDEQRELIRDQLVAKLQSKKRVLSDESKKDFETIAGMNPEEFISKLRQMPLKEIASWFTNNPLLGEISGPPGRGGSSALHLRTCRQTISKLNMVMDWHQTGRLSE